MKYFDLHCDTIYECFETGKQLRENDLCIDREKVSRYADYAQFFALFCGMERTEPGRASLLALPEEARLDALLNTARRELLANRDWLYQCYSAEELHAPERRGRAAAFLSIEGAELLTDEAAVLRAYDAGVRMVTLSWNGRNRYACGAATDNDAGLTDEGKALVRQLVSMGVIVDVSHLSDAGFWDVCVETEAPFAASHSNSRAVCDHHRNLTDLQFSEIVRRGGLVGINLYTAFLNSSGTADLSDAVRHIEHFCALGGKDCLAIGADFDGCDSYPSGIRSAADLGLLAEELLRLGYPESTVNGLFYENAVRFLDRML